MADTAEFLVDKEKLQVRVSRIFKAPRQKLWDIINDPELVPKWWGPARYETVVDVMEVRPGGRWRFVHKSAEGDYAFNGVYKEIVAPERVVMTFEFEPMPGHVSTQTMTLSELPGDQTRMDVTVQYGNLADLEGMVNSGMKEGNLESYDRLEQLL